MKKRTLRFPSSRPIVVGILLGAALMSEMSVVQKFVMGFSTAEVLLLLTPRGFAIPIVIGAIAGGSLGLVWNHRAQLAEEARLASIARLIGNISHDVKNMITPIRTGAETLELIAEDAFAAVDRGSGSGSEAAADAVAGLREFLPEFVAMTLESADAIASQTKEIADAVKGELSDPSFEPVKINEVARSVVRALEQLAQRGEVTIDTQGLGDIPEAQADAKLVYTILYNLVNNALPETPPGGAIWIRTRAEPPAPQAAQAVVIEVEDNGGGMPERVRSSLFTASAVSTKPGGTGLGTRIVKGAVDRHGGRISVESEEGRGSTFTVRLPLTQPDSPPKTRP